MTDLKLGGGAMEEEDDDNDDDWGHDCDAQPLSPAGRPLTGTRRDRNKVSCVLPCLLSHPFPLLLSHVFLHVFSLDHSNSRRAHRPRRRQALSCRGT